MHHVLRFYCAMRDFIDTFEKNHVVNYFSQ
jgi:hypothetical protein